MLRFRTAIHQIVIRQVALHQVVRATIALGAMVILASCGAQRYQIDSQKQLFTLTNLHPDEQRSLLYSVNYQMPALIPVCTPVDVAVISSKKMIFTVPSTGKKYQYVFHRRSMTEGVEAHVAKYFGEKCPDLNSMPPTDQAGIQKGIALQGMTKQGVLVAIGYPPTHQTPTLDSDNWRYWRNKFAQFEVVFTNGVVSAIR